MMLTVCLKPQLGLHDNEVNRFSGILVAIREMTNLYFTALTRGQDMIIVTRCIVRDRLPGIVGRKWHGVLDIDFGFVVWIRPRDVNAQQIPSASHLVLDFHERVVLSPSELTIWMTLLQLLFFKLQPGFLKRIKHGWFLQLCFPWHH
jgi:hypothetical protein